MRQVQEMPIALIASSLATSRSRAGNWPTTHRASAFLSSTPRVRALQYESMCRRHTGSVMPSNESPESTDATLWRVLPANSTNFLASAGSMPWMTMSAAS